MTDVQAQAPAAPHLRDDYQEVWQSGWRSGYKAALAAPVVPPVPPFARGTKESIDEKFEAAKRAVVPPVDPQKELRK